jgi:S-adenosylmethionine:tRNA ribosyltransferase-isomerase
LRRLEPERAQIPVEAAQAVSRAKREGRRVIAIGTTTTRALESAAHGTGIAAGERAADVFIAPGFRWRVVDGLLTNFHLPRSTLLMLVSALVGRERILDAYAAAVAAHYRFYSYGDAMLIC